MIDPEYDEDGQVMRQQNGANVCSGFDYPVYVVVVGALLRVEAVRNDRVENVEQIEDESDGVGQDYHQVLIEHLHYMMKYPF